MTPENETHAPASYLQRAMWAAARRYRGALLNHMIMSSRIQGLLDVRALELALGDVIARHAALRTRLSFTDGQLLQVADPPEPVELTPSTVQGASPEQRLETASTILQEDGAEALDITVGPPLRLRLLRLGEADHMLGFLVHHAMCDGWSSDVIMRDLTAFYAARTENRSADLPALSEQFSDFAAWEIRNYETGGFADEIAYWKEELTALPPPIELESIAPRRGNRDWSVACPTVAEPPEVLAALKEMVQGRRVTLFSLLLTGFAILLHHRAGAEDLVVGVSTANRWNKQAMQLVGSFTNLLPARIRLTGGLAVDELLQQVHSTVKRLVIHGRIPLALILRENQSPIDMGPVFPVWCQLRRASNRIVAGNPEVSFGPFSIDRAAIQCDLEADLIQSHRGLECVFAHRSALFAPPAMACLLADYGGLLRQMAGEPGLSVRDLCEQVCAAY